MRYCFNESKHSLTSVFDKERPDCPADLVTAKIVKKVHDMFLANRRTKVCEVAAAVGISYGRAINILHDKLGHLYAKSAGVFASSCHHL